MKNALALLIYLVAIRAFIRNIGLDDVPYVKVMILTEEWRDYL
jgi:hypothetical protein